MPENHETWHGVMSWYYHAVVKKLQNRNKFWYKFLANGASLNKACGSERECVTIVCIIRILNTSTCSSAPKLVEKSHVCPWDNF